MEVKLLRADEEGRQYGQLSQENTTYATRAPLLHLVRLETEQTKEHNCIWVSSSWTCTGSITRDILISSVSWLALTVYGYSLLAVPTVFS